MGCRRFEVLLPLQINGQATPTDLLRQTWREIESQFGALSMETQVISGFDRRTGEREEKMMRLYADVADRPESLGFFMRQQKPWAERFQQKEIRIVTFPIEVL